MNVYRVIILSSSKLYDVWFQGTDKYTALSETKDYYSLKQSDIWYEVVVGKSDFDKPSFDGKEKTKGCDPMEGTGVS